MLRMTKGLWKGAHNVEAQLLPQPNGSRICGDYEVELHGQESQLYCCGLRVLAHDGCDAMATRQLRDHEATVAHMVAVTRLVCLYIVGAKDLPRPIAGNKRGFWSSYPSVRDFLFGCVRRERVRVAFRKGGAKHWPQCWPIALHEWANQNFHGNLTSAFTSANPASKAPLVKRPVQGLVRRHCT